ncbi:hypothetical protein AB835_02190 [Candidatus Endobugula sertula]|uniref:DUF488 domain-containing protein n=1 Tax=Candidatus Endobugula sertula TaxID=62101 RepID=A0A1D2QT25_9GAMM|nr:hypothetical protein AB835_02190 [Candidatus Endobugula sertula]
MTTSPQPLYTIGYATKPIHTFIAQLKTHQINAVADIRSIPYSKVFHDYHRESIETYLQQNHVLYVYLGEELGPRSKDPDHYDDTGQVQYHQLMQSPLFKQGIERLNNGLQKGLRIALMCAEKDPATCHRSLLVGYFLARHSLSTSPLSETTTTCHILHITHEGHIESQQNLEQRLCSEHGIETDLFMSANERQQQAYQYQLKKTAYRKASPKSQNDSQEQRKL